MTLRHLLFLLTTLAAACGNIAPDDPGSKLNSEPGNGAVNNGNPGGNNDVTVDPEEWGTDGPANFNPQSPGGNAFCVLDDVKTDDLSGQASSEVPAAPWREVESDAAARCGDDTETLAWRLMNCERIGRDIEPLRCDLRLVWLGREHTTDMIERGFFSHSNPDGEKPVDRMARHGMEFRAAAENIASASDVLRSHHSWMDSTGHRENILGRLTHVGVGSETDPSGGLLSTAVFITP